MAQALEIETRAYQQIDYQPTQSANFKALLRRMHNRARHVLFSEAPFLFEQEVRFSTQPDVIPTSTVTGDKVSVNSSDAWVLERNMGGSTTGFTDWPTDNSWDGRWIEVQAPSGVWYRHQIRQVWEQKTPDYDRLTLVKPWPNRTDSNMSYRIYTPYYSLPSNISEIKMARLYNTANYPLDVKTKAEMERAGLIDFQARTSGLPQIIYKDQPFEMIAPVRAPTVADKGSSTWVGPENAGQFDFCYTYTWGIKDPHEFTEGNLPTPLWESAPSPVSAKISTTNGGFPITVKLPDIEQELGFGTAGTTRLDHSGIEKRLYARRYTSAVDGSITTFIESEQRFYEVAQILGKTEEYDFRGALLNKLKPLRYSNFYQSVGLYPMPDARYEVDIRATCTPIDLINDTDSTNINEDVVECLVQKILQFLYEWDGKPELGLVAERRYKTELEKLTKRYAGISYDLRSKRLARVNQRGSVGRSRNVTWTGIT